MLVIVHPWPVTSAQTSAVPRRRRGVASAQPHGFARGLVGGALALWLSACGGSNPPPASPPEAPPPPAAAEPAEPARAEEAEPEAPKGPKPQDVLAAPDKAWVLNFQSSEAYDKATAECDERHKDKPQERAKCVAKARDTITADAFEFTKDEAGRDVWVVYRTKSSRLIKVYSVPVEYSEEQGDSLLVKKQGRGTGTPPLFAEAPSFEVKLLGEYSLELQEPKLGRLAYDARLNFITVK